MGVQLGGLRPARDAANQEAHYRALRFALIFRAVLEAGHGKSLGALSRDLFDCGCETAAGKPYTPEMVRRMKARLEEAKQAIVDGVLEDLSPAWLPAFEVKEAIQSRNALALRWFLKMARKKWGDDYATRLMQRWQESEYASWIQTALEDP